ncbi:MAG: hypothetical protein Q9193_007100 [Seirophora villosa]
MASNSAAWLVAEKVKPLEVRPSPYALPAENEILVKNGAIAINPVDWVQQELAIFPLKYPAILGRDVAGQVVEVGQSVSRFKKGDRVLGVALCQNHIGSGFQHYTAISSGLASVIPDTMSFERACVLPLCVATAAAGLYQEDHLQLQYPSLSPASNGKALFIWGGSSSVGSNAIQLAVASGYQVLTAVSAPNFDYAKSLGASHVFDYKKSGVIDEIAEALNSTSTAGIFDAISANGAIQACLELATRVRDTKFVSTVRHPPKELPNGVTAKMAFAIDISNNKVGKAIFEDFLPQALAQGSYVAVPDAHVIGKGLEHVQAGLDYLKAGVSAQKVVVSL